MRKVGAIAVLILALTSSMAAAEKGEFLMGGAGGVAIPTGDLGDFADPGFAAGVFADYGIASNCTIGATAIYNGFGVPDDLKTLLGADDITFSVIQLTGHARYWFPSSGQVLPFVTVGGGIYNGSTKVEGGAFESDESESKGGFYGGFGVDFKASPMWRVGAEGTYHYILDATVDSAGEDAAAQVIGLVGRVSFSFAAQTQ